MSTRKIIANTISERGVFVRVGKIPFYVRPLTLAQIYRIGAIIENLQCLTIKEDEEIHPVVEIFNKYKDMKLCQRFICEMMFRRTLTRKLFSWYVRRNLTMRKYEEILKISSASLNSAFFLSSLTFLKGVNEVTKPTLTQTPIARGDLSPE
jgi:hypothetical protein